MPEATAKRPHMRLYTSNAKRLYLNRDEVAAFLRAANRAPPDICRFAYTLTYTGMRISEALSLSRNAVQAELRVISVRTLKRRQIVCIREIPLPVPLQAQLRTVATNEDHLIWHNNGRPIPRSTAYRWIKHLMSEAKITGPKACPKGLRHAYGVRAVMTGIQLHILQRWMGHASMETTAIYGTVLGPDQLELADKMWES